MRYLLDTVVWLWSIGPTENIGKMGLEILASGGEDIFLSVASCWEVAIKTQLRKFELPDVPARHVPKRLAEQHIASLSITQPHALKVYDLPPHHRDPFDRLIIAQAMIEKMTILTADRAFGKYDVEIVWCGK
jgi:PIN domain nuclease of toxin-antitoxin system